MTFFSCLSIETNDRDPLEPLECNGCTEPIEIGAKYLGGIDGSSAGASRLCKACVQHASTKLTPTTLDEWGRGPNLL
tara:strand:+ start:24742 stop:24972 length:231 start_codon:yes stop_codon:yes gene_type:complete